MEAEVMEKVQRQVPTMRFPGFKGTWKNISLENVTNKTISYGIVQAGEHVDGGMPYIKSNDLNEELSIDRLQRTSMAIAHKYRRSEVVPGDVVFSLRGNIGVSQIVPPSIEVANLTQGTARISVSDEHSNVFVQTALQTEKIIKHVLAVMKGSTFQEISLGDLRQVEIHAPTLPEQQKIAAFLGAVDRKIQQLKRKQALLEQYKKGVVQQLFSQDLRFKREDGGEFPAWEEHQLSEVLTEHKLSSTGKEEVYSVSVHKSLINQIEHLGRVYAAENTDHYNRVLPGDMVYTKSPTGEFKYGIIKQSHLDKAVIVSPLYGVFTPETRALGYWLDAYFESIINTYNYLHPIVQKGAKNTIAVTNRTFLTGTLLLPVAKEEQEKIAGFLMALDTKVAGVAQAVAAAEKWKKGLLQQMFV